MPSGIALLLCFLFIFFLLRNDYKNRSDLSHALWIPLIWLIILGSRSVSVWLNPESVVETEMAYMSGNPINTVIYISLIAIGVFILSRRGKSLSLILKNNQWIIILFLYCMLSILWSDLPLVSFRKWIRAIGNLIMVLIILTDNNPVEALKMVIRRCGYVLIPISVLLIKYYPFLGRVYDPWTGAGAFVGATTSKNMLGVLCLVFGLFFFSDILTMIKKNMSIDKKELLINVLFLGMVSWLLLKANSATSLVLFILSICMIIGLSLFKRNVRYIGLYLFIAIFIFMTIQFSLDIIEISISSVGRDMTLTGRTELWKDVLTIGANPLVGTGFESFWLGERLTILWEKHWWHPNQAHNGYIEVYLNLGVIGLILLMVIIVSAYQKIRKTLLIDFDYGIFRMVFMIIFLLHNIVEASFIRNAFFWPIFLLIAMDFPRVSQNPEINKPTSLKTRVS